MRYLGYTISGFLLIFLLSLNNSCTDIQQNKKVYAIFWFHVEEMEKVRSLGCDQALALYAPLFQKYGMKGSFLMTGMRAEVLGRQAPEVVEMISKQGVGYHGDGHIKQTAYIRSRHGNWRENLSMWDDAYLASMTWEESVAEVMRRETHMPLPDVMQYLDFEYWSKDENISDQPGGIRSVENVFGTFPIFACYHPGAGPQYIAVMKQLGVKVFQGSSTLIGNPPEFPAFWNMGLLVPYSFSLNIESLGDDPNTYEETIASIIDAFPSDKPSIIFSSPGPHDWNLVELENRNQDEVPKVNQNLYNNFERLLQVISQHPNIEVITFGELINLVEVEPDIRTISRDELSSIADYILSTWNNRPPDYIVLPNRYLTLAEGFQALAYGVSQYMSEGVLPDKVEVENLIGPVDMSAQVEADQRGTSAIPDRRLRVLSKSDLKGMVANIVNEMRSIRRIPYSINYPPKIANRNPAEALYILAQAVDQITKVNNVESILLKSADMLPSSSNNFSWATGLDIPPLSMMEVMKSTTTWALKPAKPRH